MKVTPLSEVPTIPNATSSQLLLRLPIKNDSLLALRPVTQASTSSSAK